MQAPRAEYRRRSGSRRRRDSGRVAPLYERLDRYDNCEPARQGAPQLHGDKMATNIDRSFPAHPLPKPSDATLAAASLLRNAYRDLARLTADLLPESREKSLAMTHLEDASGYAVKAVYADKVEIAPGEPVTV